MQLILLSGGSGKRLWPLSNDAYSKQFLRLLPMSDGNRESMVQRVIRQIQEAGLKADVTVATSEGQRDAISSQLGDAVSVVTEPERRDTFPAIALACMYLEKEKDAHLTKPLWSCRATPIRMIIISILSDRWQVLWDMALPTLY